eukprot:771147-Prorocentrum_minimum.AAC.1
MDRPGCGARRAGICRTSGHVGSPRRGSASAATVRCGSLGGWSEGGGTCGRQAPPSPPMPLAPTPPPPGPDWSNMWIYPRFMRLIGPS